MLELIALSLMVMVASLTGVLTVWGRAGSFVERNLDYLVSFSAGVFLVFLFGLAVEAVEHAPSEAVGVLWMFVGAAGLWLVFTLLPQTHTHVHEHDGKKVILDPRRMIATDAMHNMADGIFLAAAYAVSPLLAFSAGLSVVLHEMLQEVSEFFVLRDAGYSTRRALIVNFLVSSTILIGAIGGYVLLDVFEALESPILGLAAGGLFVVVLFDLLPHALREVEHKPHFFRHAGWFAFGALVMFFLSSIVSTVGGGH